MFRCRGASPTGTVIAVTEKQPEERNPDYYLVDFDDWWRRNSWESAFNLYLLARPATS